MSGRSDRGPEGGRILFAVEHGPKKNVYYGERRLEFRLAKRDFSSE